MTSRKKKESSSTQPSTLPLEQSFSELLINDDEESWSSAILFVKESEANLDEERAKIAELMTLVKTGRRRKFVPLEFLELFRQLQNADPNPKHKSREFGQFSAIFDAVVQEFHSEEQHEQLKASSWAKLIKLKIWQLKQSQLAAKDKISRADRAKSSVKKQNKKTPEPTTPKASTKLKTRQEMEEENKYIDDEPEDGPAAFVVVSGFGDPRLVAELCDLNVGVGAVVALSVSDVSDGTDGTDGTDARAAKQHVPSEFWTQLTRSLDEFEQGSFLGDVIVLHVRWPKVHQLSEDGGDAFDELAQLMYQLTVDRRQWNNYLRHLRLIDFAAGRAATPEADDDRKEAEAEATFETIDSTGDEHEDHVAYILDRLVSRADYEAQMAAEAPEPEEGRKESGSDGPSDVLAAIDAELGELALPDDELRKLDVSAACATAGRDSCGGGGGGPEAGGSATRAMQQQFPVVGIVRRLLGSMGRVPPEVPAKFEQLAALCCDETTTRKEVEQALLQLAFEAMALQSVDALGLNDCDQQTPAGNVWDLAHEANSERGEGRCLDEWCFTESLGRDRVLQILLENYRHYSHTDLCAHRQTGCLLVACHAPRNEQGIFRKTWRVDGHSNVGFRHYLEHVKERIEDLNQEEEAEYRGRKMATEVQSMHRQDSKMTEGNLKNVKKSKSKSKSRSRSRSKTPPREFALVTNSSAIRAHSIKAKRMQDEELASGEQAGEKSPRKGRNTDKQNKEKTEMKREQTEEKLKSKTAPSGTKKSEASDSKLLYQILGYRMNGQLLHSRGEMKRIYCSDGSFVIAESVQLSFDSFSCKAIICRGRNMLTVHYSPKGNSLCANFTSGLMLSTSWRDEDARLPEMLDRSKESSTQLEQSNESIGKSKRRRRRRSSSKDDGRKSKEDVRKGLRSAKNSREDLMTTSCGSFGHPPEVAGKQNFERLKMSLTLPTGLIISFYKASEGDSGDHVIVRQRLRAESRWQFADGRLLRAADDGKQIQVLAFDGTLSDAEFEADRIVGWRVTTPKGERYTTYNDEQLDPINVSKFTDPHTLKVLYSREDNVATVCGEDGTTQTEFADRTRITRYGDGDDETVQKVLFQHPDFAAVTFGKTECHVEFRDTSVYIFSGKFIELSHAGVMVELLEHERDALRITSNQSIKSDHSLLHGDLSNRRMNASIVSQDLLSYTLCKSEKELLHVRDPGGVDFIVQSDGNVAFEEKQTHLEDVQLQHMKVLFSEEKMDTRKEKAREKMDERMDEKMEGNTGKTTDDKKEQRADQENDQRTAVGADRGVTMSDIYVESSINMTEVKRSEENNALHLMVIRPDLTGTQLLRYVDVKDELLSAERDPAAATIVEPLEGQKDVFAITILRPEYPEPSWILPFAESIIPEGLISRDFKTLSKKWKPTTAEPPCKLQMRRLIQRQPLSEQLRARMWAGLQQLQQPRGDRQNVEDDGSDEHKFLCDDSNSEETMKLLYERLARQRTEGKRAAAPRPKPGQYAQSLEELQEERRNKRELLEKKVVPYFQSEYGQAYLVSQSQQKCGELRNGTNEPEINEVHDGNTKVEEKEEANEEEYKEVESVREEIEEQMRREAEENIQEEDEYYEKKETNEVNSGRRQIVSEKKENAEEDRRENTGQDKEEEEEEEWRREIEDGECWKDEERAEGSPEVAEAKASFKLSPSAVNFGNVEQGKMYAAAVELRNHGPYRSRFRVRQPPPSSGLSVRFRPGQIAAGLARQLRVELCAVGLDAGTFRHKIRIETERESLQLLVNGAIL